MSRLGTTNSLTHDNNFKIITFIIIKKSWDNEARYEFNLFCYLKIYIHIIQSERILSLNICFRLIMAINLINLFLKKYYKTEVGTTLNNI